MVSVENHPLVTEWTFTSIIKAINCAIVLAVDVAIVLWSLMLRSKIAVTMIGAPFVELDGP
jgi:hypothetical protein